MAKRSARSQDVAPSVCPHLGLKDEAKRHEDQPSRDHRCYFTNPPQRIDLDHQRSYCLTSACAECPWLTVMEPALPVQAEEPDEREQLERVMTTVGKGVETVVHAGAPVVKDVARSAFTAIQGGTAELQDRLATAQAERQRSHDQAQATTANEAEAPSAAEPATPVEEEPPAYRIIAPELKPTMASVALRPKRRQLLSEAARMLAAIGAFAAALFWLSSIYRTWLPAETAAQAYWPLFNLPQLPLTFTIDYMNLSFDPGVAIAPLVGGLWAWLAFGLLRREDSMLFTAVLFTVSGILAQGQLVHGAQAGQLGFLLQTLPSLFVLVARATRAPAQPLIGWTS